MLWLVQHGLSDRQIARLRGTSLDAVKFHRRNIAGKVQASGRDSLRYWRRDRATNPARTEAGTMSDQPVALNGIGQVSLESGDIERSVAFFRDTLGLTHLYTFPHPTGSLAFFDLDGLRLFISSHDDRPPEKSSVLYFTVADIEGTYATLTARGVPFEGAPHLVHRHESGVEEWMAFFRDPDANLLALMSQVTPA